MPWPPPRAWTPVGHSRPWRPWSSGGWSVPRGAGTGGQGSTAGGAKCEGGTQPHKGSAMARPRTFVLGGLSILALLVQPAWAGGTVPAAGTAAVSVGLRPDGRREPDPPGGGHGVSPELHRRDSNRQDPRDRRRGGGWSPAG